MATTRAILLPEQATFPTANAPELRTVTVSPIPRLVLAYDAATDETAYWTFIAPQGIAGAITCIVHFFAASATSGAFRFEGKLEAVTSGDSLDLDAATSFDSTNSNGGTTPGTAGHPSSISITMTNADSIAAGDVVRLALNRDADGTTGTDDATGDCYVYAVEIQSAT